MRTLKGSQSGHSDLDGVTRWPVNLKELPRIFENCLRVIRRLEPEAGVGCDAVEKTLKLA